MIIDNTTDKPKKPRTPRKPKEVATTLELNDPALNLIGEFADSLGVEIYVVGGYVRDYFLGGGRKDYDFTVIGDPIEFAKKLGARLGVFPVLFERFRTAMLPWGEGQLEFVGARREEYEHGSRKPIVAEGGLADDLKRRDFTINAMAASLNKGGFGRLVDMFQGQKDLQEKLLRTPLEPGVTFRDDPLRMMRAARFASTLNFQIEDNAYKALAENAEELKNISQERITDEFLKILLSPAPSIGLRILHETGMLKIFFPELHALGGVDTIETGRAQYGHKDVLQHSFKVVDNISKTSGNVWLRFAALIHDIGKPRTKSFIPSTGWSFHGHEEVGARMTRSIFKKLKLPFDHIEYVERLIRLHQRPMALVDDEITDSAVRRLAFHAGSDLADLFALCRADITTKNPNLTQKYLSNYDKVFQKTQDVQEKDKLREFQSPVRGEEIMEVCGLGPCRAVGYIKNKIEEAILDGLIPNEYEAAKAYFLRAKEGWLDEMPANYIHRGN